MRFQTIICNPRPMNMQPLLAIFGIFTVFLLPGSRVSARVPFRIKLNVGKIIGG